MLDGSRDVDPSAPTAPWGRDDTLGTDAVSARGNFFGDPIADALGGTGCLEVDDGGRSKALEPVGADAAVRTSPARVIHSGLKVDGPLSQPAVLSTVAPRFGRFRECFERALEREPALRGRVDLQLDVDPNGAAENVRIMRSDLTSPEMTPCLVGALAGLSFSAADGPSVVTYPLAFMPSTSGEQPAQP
jgi:hypothetical protein